MQTGRRGTQVDLHIHVARSLDDSKSGDGTAGTESQTIDEMIRTHHENESAFEFESLCGIVEFPLKSGRLREPVEITVDQ